jgi:hypothetical protein
MSLCELLQCINDLDTIAIDPDEPVDQFLPDTFTFNKEDMDTGACLLTKASQLADELFIDPYGGINWDNINTFCNKCDVYDVYPLESDSFGWLVGGIKTKKGIVVFG